MRIFADPKTGFFQIEWRENGRRLTRSLKHRDLRRAKRQADEFAAGFAGPELNTGQLPGVSGRIGWRFHVALVLAHETGHRIGAIRKLRWTTSTSRLARCGGGRSTRRP